MDFASIWVILKAESCWAALILYRIGNILYHGEPEPVSLSVGRSVFFVSFLSLPRILRNPLKVVCASSRTLGLSCELISVIFCFGDLSVFGDVKDSCGCDLNRNQPYNKFQVQHFVRHRS